MTISYPSFSSATHVPQGAAKNFVALHDSLCISKGNLKNSGIALVYNRSLSKGEILAIYNNHISAIKKLLTDNFFKDFWQKCSDQQAQDFYNIWQRAFNDWTTKPAIKKKEKVRKLKQAKGHIDKIIALVDSDPSLQREIGIAVTNAVNRKWPKTRNAGDGWETMEIHTAEIFLRILSKELDEISAPDSWQSTHANYPTQIQEPSAKTQFFIGRLSPLIFNVFGEGEHAKVSAMIKALFPDVMINRDTVRKAVAE